MQINIVGLKFQPSDQLLVGYHLYNKITGKEPLDFETTIQECDLYGEKEPWEIWEMYGGNSGFKQEEDLYFFTRLKKKTLKSKRINRTIGCGTWKGEDSGKPIFVGGLEKPIGFKKLFRYEGGGQQNSGWILHEYSLDSWVLQQSQATEYVLCRMRKNRDKRKRCAGALNSDACRKRFKAEETPRRVEHSTGTTVPAQVVEYGLAVGEVGDRNGSPFNQQVLPIEPFGVSTLTMGATVSQGDNIDGLEMVESGDNNGSLSKDMRREEVLPIEKAGMLELTMARSEEQKGEAQDELAITELGSHESENLGLDVHIESTEMSELLEGQEDDEQTNMEESDGCKYSSLEEFPTLKPSGSNTSTTTMQCLWDIPWDDAYLSTVTV